MKELGQEYYARCHLEFRRVTDQQERMLEWMHSRPECVQAQSVLSIGCGAGVLDKEFVRRSSARKYTGIDPNGGLLGLFISNMSSSGVQVHAHKGPVEDFSTAERYDLAHMIHVLYYLDEPERSVRNALSLLREQGTLLVMIAPDSPMSEPFRRTFSRLYGREPYLGPDLEDFLMDNGLRYQKSVISAEVDVTDCLKRTQRGIDILSFIAHADLRGRKDLQDEVESLLVGYTREGRTFCAHPVECYLIKAR